MKQMPNLALKSWKSDNCLFEPQKQLNKPSHSGSGEKCIYDGHAEDDSMYSPPIFLPAHMGRKRSISLGNIPKSFIRFKEKELSHNSLGQSYDSVNSEEPDAPKENNFHASALKSSKSIEMLDIEEISNHIQTSSGLPVVPKRTSAFLENCTVKDEYLTKVGQRMSRGIDLSDGEKPFKFQTLFRKLGNVLKRVGSSNSLTSYDQTASAVPVANLTNPSESVSTPNLIIDVETNNYSHCPLLNSQGRCCSQAEHDVAHLHPSNTLGSLHKKPKNGTESEMRNFYDTIHPSRDPVLNLRGWNEKKDLGGNFYDTSLSPGSVTTLSVGVMEYKNRSTESDNKEQITFNSRELNSKSASFDGGIYENHCSKQEETAGYDTYPYIAPLYPVYTPPPLPPK